VKHQYQCWAQNEIAHQKPTNHSTKQANTTCSRYSINAKKPIWLMTIICGDDVETSISWNRDRTNTDQHHSILTTTISYLWSCQKSTLEIINRNWVSKKWTSRIIIQHQTVIVNQNKLKTKRQSDDDRSMNLQCKCIKDREIPRTEKNWFCN
jgi:hypothetical protein